MAISPTGLPLSGLLPASQGTDGVLSVSTGNAASRAGGIPFGDLVSNLLKETNDQQQNIGVEVQKLVTGESDSVHDVVLSIARADLSFRLVMEMRDQLISSYQEIMRMQV